VQISHPAPVNQTLRRKIDPRSSRAVSQQLSRVSTFPIAPARKMTIEPSQLNSQKGVIWSLELKHFQEQFSELLLDMTKSGHNKT
ncbi:MAG: hypothetical protein WA760_06145, partial [Pseudolabrys sp.]